MKRSFEIYILTVLGTVFSLGLSTAILAQSDTPCTAPFLVVESDSCIFHTGTTVGATYQSDALNGGIPPCASPGAPDVWYRFIVPAGGAVAVTTVAGTITDEGMALYAGPCNALVPIGCDDDGAQNFMPVVDRSGLTPGDTLYIRFWKAWGAGTGTFGLCVIASNSDCESATFICNEKHFPRNTYGPGSHLDAYSSFNCGITEYQSQWLCYKFQTSGSFTFMIYPDSIGPSVYPDYDWILYQSNDPNFCAGFDSSYSPLVCNASSSQGPLGSTGLDPGGVSNSVPPGPGNPFCPVMNVNAGDIYYLFINNFSTTSTGYQIDFGGTAQLDCLLTDLGAGDDGEPVLSIFPNPAGEEIHISFSLETPAWLSVYDISGRTVLQKPLILPLHTEQITAWKNGPYLIRVETESRRWQKVFIKQGN